MNTTKAVIIAVAVIAIIAGSFVACSKKKENETPVLDAIATGVSNFVEEEIVGEEGGVNTISESTLKEVLEISQMSTAEYTYNSLLQKSNEKNEIEYSVCYNGTITAGIDFSKIEIEIDDNAKTINVTVPKAEINSINVDAGSLEYIFENEKYNTETVNSEAYALAVNDLEQKAYSNTEILTLAKENAISTVEALLQPWTEQIAGYTTTVK